MLKKILTTQLCLLMPVFILGSTLSQAQEAAADTPSAESADPDFGRSRLHFIDRPMAIESEFDDRVFLPAERTQDPSEDDPEFKRRLDSINQYNESVQSMEQSGGVWNPALVEELYSLGSLHQQQGDHGQAVDIFDRAVHVSRINNGLHTLDQISAVEQMIESYLAMKQWDKADLYYDYLFYIQQKAYGISDPRIIPVLDRLASWNLRAFNIGYGESLGMRLSKAQTLFEAAAAMVRAHFGKSDERFLRYQQAIANSAFLAMQHPDLMRELNTTEFRMNQEQLLNKLGNMEQSRARGFQAGELALQEIVSAHIETDADPRLLGEAFANLADWYLLFKQRRAAEELYADAWLVISQIENSEEVLAQMFGQVKPLPTFLGEPTTLVFNGASVTGTEDLLMGYADLEFDVTATGIVRNLRIVSEEPEEIGPVLSRLRREVRNSIFRPVIEDGVAVRKDGNQFRYRYWY